MPPSPTPHPGLLPDGSSLDFSRTGVGWVDFAIDLAVILAIVFGAVYGVYIKSLKPLLLEIRKHAKISSDQTANSHGSAKNPNLRDDLDAKFAQVRQDMDSLAKLLVRLEDGQTRHDKELSRVQDSVTADREATRHIGERLDSHIRDKQSFEPRLSRLEHQLEAHREVMEEDS